MIRESDDSSILQDDDNNNVIIHPVNCRAVAQRGLALQISKKYSGWFRDFHSYCSWFGKSTWDTHDHFDQIMGSFHRFQPDDKTIVCSAFVQEAPSKGKSFADLDMWHKILIKVERQTKRVKQLTGKTWILHMQSSVCQQESIDGETVMSVVEEVFGDSDVEIVIHGSVGDKPV